MATASNPADVPPGQELAVLVSSGGGLRFTFRVVQIYLDLCIHIPGIPAQQHRKPTKEECTPLVWPGTWHMHSARVATFSHAVQHGSITTAAVSGVVVAV
jgi:hypothetical protein